MRPLVSYIGTPKRFIAGSVLLGDKEDEWAENVTVTLIDKKGEKTIKTDNFGDFEFEGLQPETEYAIKIAHRGYAPKEFHVQTKTDVYLGEIALSPNPGSTS